MDDKCEGCGSNELEDATMMSTAIAPNRAGRLAKAMSGAEVTCRVCLGCGRIDRLKADTERLRKMLD